MASKEEQKKKKTQQDLDSILDAALDELEDDSDHDNCDDYKEVTNALDQNVDDGSGPSQPMAAAIESDGNAATMGVPYSLEYLANNPHGDNNKQTISEINNRPKFGPEPPPPPPPSTDHGLSAEEANLAASLEGMMKQFASGLDSAGVDFNSADEAANMADLENAEKALEEMFKKMMMGDADGISMPSTPPSSTGGAASGGQSKKSAKSKSATVKNGKSSNNKETNEKNEPDVDESINRLLDGINQASTTPQHSNTNGPTMPIPPNIDPSELEHLSEQMMGSLMNDFEQLNTSKDSNDVVDGVMKQLLDKELMYEPMKEVCKD
mmetsp:Transcript_3521/g.5413  ORF Transcript_3521/g.5413 Transcript_3521/m.5413 type:complete len:323 (-) Transcript_3521:139-1107(-)